MSVKVKICGLTRPDDVRTANQSGADLFGFVFYKPSPRYVSAEKAAALASLCAPHIERVAMLVDADDAIVDMALAALSPHWLQLHGAETPERVAQIKLRSHCSIIKALPVAQAADLARARDYEACVDWFLFDARPPEGGLSGGNGKAFDWTALNAYDGSKPYLLAGGLTADNVADALRISGASMVDISSGVETAPGVKDAALMQQFVTAARAV